MSARGVPVGGLTKRDIGVVRPYVIYRESRVICLPSLWRCVLLHLLDIGFHLPLPIKLMLLHYI